MYTFKPIVFGQQEIRFLKGEACGIPSKVVREHTFAAICAAEKKENGEGLVVHLVLDEHERDPARRIKIYTDLPLRLVGGMTTKEHEGWQLVGFGPASCEASIARYTKEGSEILAYLWGDGVKVFLTAYAASRAEPKVSEKAARELLINAKSGGEAMIHLVKTRLIEARETGEKHPILNILFSLKDARLSAS